MQVSERFECILQVNDQLSKALLLYWVSELIPARRGVHIFCLWFEVIYDFIDVHDMLLRTMHLCGTLQTSR
jgi:hypothetical protein